MKDNTLKGFQKEIVKEAVSARLLKAMAESGFAKRLIKMPTMGLKKSKSLSLKTDKQLANVSAGINKRSNL